jgi:hypothetical protein
VEVYSSEQESLLTSLLYLEEQIKGKINWWIGLTDIMHEDW